MSSPLVTFDSVSLSFGSNLVLDDISWQLERGESLCVIGPNGGGKTTLLKLLLGILEPDKGRIDALSCGKIGYVPQAIKFDSEFPVSVIDIVLMGRLDRLKVGFFSKPCREAARSALSEVGLLNKESVPFSNLSGGERQRVLIARALASEPELLVLDEPTANVDLTVEANLLDTLDRLKDRLTIMLVTHDLDVVARVGHDSVLCVNRRVHRHSLPLSGDTVREIYSGEKRVDHDVKTRHKHGDHSDCDHG